jgi:hypothetical protein
MLQKIGNSCGGATIDSVSAARGTTACPASQNQKPREEIDMKKILTSTAVLALMAGVSPAMAQCNIGQATNYTAEDDAVASGARRDLRQLRNSAMILNTYGQEAACQQVVEAIQEIRGNRGQMTSVGNDQVQQQAADTQQVDYLQNMQQAKPVSEIGGRLTVNQMMDADLRGSQGEVVGEISNIILGQDGQPSHAIVAFGGFLGLGEDRVAIPFDKLKVHATAQDMDNVIFYVPMTEEQLTNAPRVRENDDSWLSDDNWVSQNEEYYNNNIGEG